MGVPKWRFVECPKCRAIGRVDEEQWEGRASIICSNCGHHWTNK